MTFCTKWACARTPADATVARPLAWSRTVTGYCPMPRIVSNWVGTTVLMSVAAQVQPFPTVVPHEVDAHVPRHLQHLGRRDAQRQRVVRHVQRRDGRLQQAARLVAGLLVAARTRVLDPLGAGPAGHVVRVPIPVRPKRDVRLQGRGKRVDLERRSGRVPAHASGLVVLVEVEAGVVVALAVVTAVVGEHASGAGLDRDQRTLQVLRLARHRYCRPTARLAAASAASWAPWLSVVWIWYPPSRMNFQSLAP